MPVASRSCPRRAIRTIAQSGKAAWLLLLGMILIGPALADVTNPEEVAGVTVDKSGADVIVSWDPVTLDVTGNPETVDSYRIFRGLTPDFIPDKTGGSNEIGNSLTTGFTDVGVANDGIAYHYLVTAVDTAVNESRSKAPIVTTPPVLTGFWTDTTIEIDWTHAEPQANVASYRIYYGPKSGMYDFVDDVSAGTTSRTLSSLTLNANWYITVVAVDLNGNESAFSGEHIDVVAGTIDIRAQDESELCWGASKCTPAPPIVQRSDGFETLVPIEMPEGDWTNITVTWTIESRLCSPPTVPDKCGNGNPGGWNPCGDPWDRTGHLYMVLDDCINQGGSCQSNGNLELIRAITPFGTDADPPDGDGVVPPRVHTMDITPYRSLLVGERYIGTKIVHFVQTGWWTTVDFHFSKRPEEISLKPPADGVEVLFFGGANPPTKTLNVPAEAEEVYTRLFTTGHGGNSRCDGGSNDGGTCASSAECPGGSCQNCDEFCHRTNQIIVGGTPVWEEVPWRDDCTPGGITDCANWNACGWPSCTFSRAGWCPGYIACHHDAPCDQDLDMTLALPAGASHDVDYNVLVNTGSWSVSLVAFWYNDSTAVCGNGVREGNELCDGTDNGSATCATQGFDVGPLVCNGTCDGFDTSGCRFFVCGDGICESTGGEDCETCVDDCEGVQGGNPGNRFCCGDPSGAASDYVDCSDPRCNANGNTCE